MATARDKGIAPPLRPSYPVAKPLAGMILPTLPDSALRILHAHQVKPAQQQLRALQNGAIEWGYPGAVDLSDVGVGKSFMGLAAALATGRRVGVLCPVVGIKGWRETFAIFGAEPHYIGSYEGITGGWRKDVVTFKDKRAYWKNPHEITLILDEAHKVKGDESQTTYAIGGAIYDNIPMIAASASMASSPVEMRIAGRITGLHQGGKDWNRFLVENGAKWDELDERWTWDRRQIHILEKLNSVLIPERGCRVRKSDVGTDAGTTIMVLPLECKEGPGIEKRWRDLNEKVKEMERKRMSRAIVQGYYRKVRMSIWKDSEIALVPHVLQRVYDCLHEGKSVAVFFSFTESRELMAKLMGGCDCGIYGGQSDKQRNNSINAFQRNEKHVILCNIVAAGSSVSLHDKTGERARETFIFPTDKSVAMKQAPGRVWRDGGMTHSYQWIPCIAGGFSEKMVVSTAKKISAMNALNDGQMREAA